MGPSGHRRHRLALLLPAGAQTRWGRQGPRPGRGVSVPTPPTAPLLRAPGSQGSAGVTAGLSLEAGEGGSVSWQSPVAREVVGFLVSRSPSEISGRGGNASEVRPGPRPGAGVSGTWAPTLFPCVSSHAGVPHRTARDTDTRRSALHRAVPGPVSAGPPCTAVARARRPARAWRPHAGTEGRLPAPRSFHFSGFWASSGFAQQTPSEADPTSSAPGEGSWMGSTVAWIVPPKRVWTPRPRPP